MHALKEEAFIVRHAAPADVPALTATIAKVDEETEFLGKPGEYMQRWAPGLAERLAAMNEKGTGAYFLAEHGGEIVGFLGAVAGALKRTRGVVYISHVGVRATWRGRGVGSALFAAIEEWARGQGAWRLDLRVDTQNARGIALYQKHGFAVEGRIVDGALRDGVWCDHFLMAKALRILTEPLCVPLELAPAGEGADGPVSFRRLRAEDARALRRFQLALTGETPFLLMQPADVPDAAATAAKVVEDLEDPGQFDLVAVTPSADGERIVGHALVDREDGTRMRHNAYVAINVLRNHWRRGIGRQLAAAVDTWAREQSLRRLTGVILAHNSRALRFATAAGFREELVSPRYAVIHGRAVDRVRVVKFL
ncbi:MAG TPA: GNAT family N-acetyltransferase [Xanthobacteraceae bacterium]|jgi:RimJ/RimL family protein N-acetyltransferase|nr:GNAT family N-acetyltransferase [Xanthobacteraceae bacterium]